MPSFRYQPTREKLLKSFKIKRLMDFRNTQSRFVDFTTKPKCNFSKDEWIKLRIDRISKETHNSKRFTLTLPSEDYFFPIVSSYRFKGYDLLNDNAELIKKYTPVNSVGDANIDFVIKYYKTGKMTPYLFGLNEGDYLEVNGPIESGLQYPFEDRDRIGMIAGGTGITPMIQVLKQMALHQRYDTRFVDLLYANQTKDDYLCQSDLMSLKIIMKERLNINDFFEHSANNKKFLLPNSWNAKNIPRLGRVDIHSMKELLPKPSDKTLILLCGTPGMKAALYGEKSEDGGRELTGTLGKIGYTKEMIHVF